MIAADKEALLCDLWQVYGIREPREVPARKLGMLCGGLGPDSRIRMALSGIRYPVDTLLLAHTVDSLRTLIWFQTKDGHKGRNPPKKLIDVLTGRSEEKKDSDIRSFSSGEAFEEARRKLLERAGGGGEA